MSAPDAATNALTLEDFDYVLPEGLIAQYPLPERDASRMLCLSRETGALTHRMFRELPDFLQPGDLVVVNNAKVIPARLIGQREGFAGTVELLLVNPENEAQTQWQVLMRPARRLRPGTRVQFGSTRLTATILEQLDAGQGRVQLDWPADMTFETALAEAGQIPLPPYMARAPEAQDTHRYQTVFARSGGAKAAPTAGLHFTEAMFAALAENGIDTAEVTLDVSTGTFRPVLADHLADHRMDAERYHIPPETAEAIARTRSNGGRILCIGTTVAKTLETSALRHGGRVVAETAWSDVFITPGFAFQVADGLLTNFHLPRSTLLMLVSAFARRDSIMAAYQAAIEAEYRFYSYGDCMLIS